MSTENTNPTKRVRTPNQIAADKRRQEDFAKAREEKKIMESLPEALPEQSVDERIQEEVKKQMTVLQEQLKQQPHASAGEVVPIAVIEPALPVPDKTHPTKLPWDNKDLVAQITFSCSLEMREWLRGPANSEFGVSATVRSAVDDYFLKNA